MHFESLSELFAMGGYAGYVWSAFGITFLSMIILLISSIRRGDALLKEVKAKIKSMLTFISTLTSWFDQVKALPKPTLIALMKMGNAVVKLIPEKLLSSKSSK